MIILISCRARLSNLWTFSVIYTSSRKILMFQRNKPHGYSVHILRTCCSSSAFSLNKSLPFWFNIDSGSYSSTSAGHPVISNSQPAFLCTIRGSQFHKWTDNYPECLRAELFSCELLLFKLLQETGSLHVSWLNVVFDQNTILARKYFPSLYNYYPWKWFQPFIGHIFTKSRQCHDFRRNHGQFGFSLESQLHK